MSVTIGKGFEVLGFCETFWPEIPLGSEGRCGGASSKCQRFFPIAQTSSQELPPTFIPWVLQSQAMSQARKVMPSMKDA